MEKRNFDKGIIKSIISIVAITLSLFHLYTAGFGILRVTQQRSFHLGLILFLVFMLVPGTNRSSKKRIPWYDIVFAVLAIACNFYMFFMKVIVTVYRLGLINNFDLLVGIILVLLLLEAARRVVGKEIVGLMVFAIIYMRFGNYFSGFLRHRGITFFRIIDVLTWTNEGVYGLTLGVSATYVYTFILLGIFLSKTGIAHFFNDVAIGLTGHSSGGPAKVSIIASALMGTVSGSAVSNVVTTGTFTIPLMRKVGYSPTFAAAVEAVASTGGQLAPPVMGAAAFIIAEYLGISYIRVLSAAIIPAILYYFSLWMMIHLRAKKIGLSGLDREELPSVKKALKERGIMLIPLIAIVYLLIKGFTPLYAAFYSIIIALVLSLIKKETRLAFKDYVDGLIEAAIAALAVATACGVVGIMVGMMGITGLGSVLSGGIIRMAGGSLFLTLLFTAGVSLLLGVGLPPTAVYIIVAIVAAPPLQLLGVTPLCAHLFVFYFGIIAAITPPVALAAFTAAGLVNEDPYKVGVKAFMLGIAAYFIPFIFVLSPSILLIDANIVNLFFTLLTLLVGVTALCASVQGYLFTKIGLFARSILLIAGISLMYEGLLTDIIGLMVLVPIFLINYYFKFKSGEKIFRNKKSAIQP